ncbi:hypothetical protein HZF08_24210 [Paenibacillus sp. CGMCC 1.16610]|uniref:Chromosome partitioning protein ParB n=1 Tax=Paenibacillus anseongense TaxID=2682845 RepID=A0ABW9UJ85_9BACL|nr:MULTISPECIES: hypothetical protein [Paenibacillus]MBA2941390.1 hypothetical protein [Paenibacillus sp. CGMCC 1.16610]MVQ40209.1 hypothetical protein [Paenibacillus anseongense]
MRYTVQYISLSKIKPESTTTKTSQRKKELKKVAQDLMHLLVVQKSKKDKGYVVVDGHHHLNFLKKHTHKQSVVCLVDESKLSTSVGKFMDRFRKQPLPYDLPAIKSDRVTVSSWSIIRTFLKREPRFRKLSRRQQLKVLRLGMQYKKTTVRSMQEKVDELFKKMVTH